MTDASTEVTLNDIYVSAGIIWRNNREILCCQRPAGKPLAGYWEFPGGKLEPGEDARHALDRELSEELGIRVSRATLWKTLVHEYQDKKLRVHLSFFYVTGFSGTPSSREGQSLLWQDYHRADELNFLPADAALVRALSQPDNPEQDFPQ